MSTWSSITLIRGGQHAIMSFYTFQGTLVWYYSVRIRSSCEAPEQLLIPSQWHHLTFPFQHRVPRGMEGHAHIQPITSATDINTLIRILCHLLRYKKYPLRFRSCNPACGSKLSPPSLRS
jgi:hypothetical protein